MEKTNIELGEERGGVGTVEGRVENREERVGRRGEVWGK